MGRPGPDTGADLVTGSPRGTASAARTEGFSGPDVLRWVRAFAVAFEAERERLTDLDRLSGDGDFGANLHSALGKVQARLEVLTDPAVRPADVLEAVSLGFLDTGGTSGPLFGMWFRALARAQDGPWLTTASLATGVRAGTDTVQRLGHSRPGDKTMVDALVPAAEALERAAEQERAVADALAAAAEAAATGAAATADLLARRGRASYVGELARGVLDPGAELVALLFRSALVDATAPPSDEPLRNVDQDYLLARERHILALVRWRAAGGHFPPGGVPTQPELWSAICVAQDALLAVSDQAGPTDAASLLAAVEADEAAAVEEAIAWLEADHFVLHSGYYKQKLMRRVRRATLTPSQIARLQTLVLAVCRRGRREEFSETCRLAVRLDDDDWRIRLRSMRSGCGSTSAAAATRILEALESRGTHR